MICFATSLGILLMNNLNCYKQQQVINNSQDKHYQQQKLQMGNLQMSNPRQSTFQRKPIFHQAYSPFRQQNSRSLSPYLLKTSRSIMNRSSFIKGQQKTSNLSTRKYLNPNMVKSVIKDSRTQHVDADRSNILRFRKSVLAPHNQQRSFHMNHSTFIRASEVSGSRKKYIQKQFQELSPNSKQNFSRKSKHERENQESRGNQKNIGFNQYIETHGSKSRQNVKDFSISSIKKSYGNTINMLRSESNSARNYGLDGHLYQDSGCKCCFHSIHKKKYQQNLLPPCILSSDKEKTNEEQLTDNAPTQRKKAPQVPIYLFNPFQKVEELQNKVTRIKTQQDVSMHSLNQTHTQNHNKCQEIIKRVRNFNEFLNQIKKKVKKQYQTFHSNSIEQVSISEADQSNINQYNANSSVSQQNSSLGADNQSRRKTSQGSQPKSITLALKLENEKIELEKYRKMVERELSKQHSIESIQIQTKNKQKIITINFQKQDSNDSKISKQKIQSQAQPQTAPAETTHIKIRQKYERYKRQTDLKSNSDTTTIKSSKAQLQKQGLKSQQKVIKGNKKEDEKELAKLEEQKQVEKEDKASIAVRMSKINTLFSKMEDINKEHLDTYREICHIFKKEHVEGNDYQDG